MTARILAILVLVGTLVAGTTVNAQEILGKWSANFSFGNVELNVTKVSEAGNVEGTMTLPERFGGMLHFGATPDKAKKVGQATYKKDNLIIVMPSGGIYDLRVGADGNLSGTYFRVVGNESVKVLATFTRGS